MQLTLVKRNSISGFLIGEGIGSVLVILPSG